MRHPPEKVWKALTDPASLREWAPFDADRRPASVGPVKFNPLLYPLNAEIPLTQEEIGYLSGITRQKVNLAVRQMDALGLLSVSLWSSHGDRLERIAPFRGSSALIVAVAG